MNGADVAASASIGNVPTNRTVVGVADFNGDGIGDLLWCDGSGDVAVWLMSTAMVMSSTSLGNVPSTWTVVGAGDFNGDGMVEILWQDNLGDTSIWFMNGATVSSAGGIGKIRSSWSVVETGDLNGGHERHRLARCHRRLRRRWRHWAGRRSATGRYVHRDVLAAQPSRWSRSPGLSSGSLGSLIAPRCQRSEMSRAQIE
jgi:FG-GAP-like repeat